MILKPPELKIYMFDWQHYPDVKSQPFLQQGQQDGADTGKAIVTR